MALFPKIQSPCPYKGNIADILDGDVCRLCKREVFDLTAMSNGQRLAFMSGCGTQVCVKYSVRPALAAAALAAAAIVAPSAAAACETTQTEWVVVGGIKDTAHVQYVQLDPADTRAPSLPVVYDDPPPAKDGGKPAPKAP